MLRFTRPELVLMLDGMLDGVSIIDSTGEQIYVNQAMCTMLGFSREELLGKRAPYPYWPAEQLEVIQAAFERFVAGESKNLELQFQRRDGTPCDVIVAPGTLSDERGTVVARFATIKDISEQKRLSRSLLESQERWRSIAENPFDFVVLIDRDYRYTYVNHAAPGISPETLIGRATPFDFVDPEHHDTMRAAFETTFKTGRPTAYDVHVPQLGAWYASIVGPMFERGEVIGLSIMTREITDQKRAEQALQQSEQRLRESHKLETLGTLAGGIAHDVNNMLTPILAYARLAQQELPREHPVQEYLHTIGFAGERAGELVKRILLFSRRQELDKTTFDLRDLVREHTTLIRASMPATIELVIDVPDDPIHVLADRSQLGQVLANLASNALQAMPHATGRLSIAVSPAREQVVLSVTDTGSGMDAATLERAFEPFFTTKPVGAGTGLGLSIVHSVVREHGGHSEIRSAPGEGTSILLRLPTVSTPGATAPEAPSVSSRGRSLRVLVVDDERMIVNVLTRILRSAGHIVTAHTSAEAALEAFLREPGAFDVVITDEAMPSMRGTTFIAALRDVHAAVKCILITGRADEVLQRRAEALQVLQIIAKPFEPQALLEALDRV